MGSHFFPAGSGVDLVAQKGPGVVWMYVVMWRPEWSCLREQTASLRGPAHVLGSHTRLRVRPWAQRALGPSGFLSPVDRKVLFCEHRVKGAWTSPLQPWGSPGPSILQNQAK